MNKKYPLYLLIISSVIMASSCADTRKVTSFNNVADTTMQYTVQSLEPIIQKNDILSISVSSMNTDATQPFNLHTITTNQGAVNSGTISQVSGFLVDQEGYIRFPMLGRIKAAGLTKRELIDVIAGGLIQKKLLYEPIVDIRYLNYKVTVLGEVARPGVINVPGEKITLLDALGLAGDLTPYASRDNVLVIRENEEGKRITKRLNLTDQGIFTSDYYYLKSNDVVYVAPNKAKAASTSTTKQWLPVVISTMSFVVVLIDLLTRD